MSCRLRRPSKTHHLKKTQNPDHTEFIASVFIEKYRKGKEETTSTTETAKACMLMNINLNYM